MEALFAAGDITRNDVEQVYAGLFMDVFTEFETVIESLFLGLLSGSLYSTNYPTKCKAKIRPASMTRQIVFGFRPYIDWLPYSQQTVPRARNYFDDGKPFTLLNPSQESNLDGYCIIRNALAHKSDKAYSKFQELIRGFPLLPSERSPAGYLRTTPYAISNQTQYEIAVLEFIAILKVLC
jgi:hypothetical protein